MIIKGGSRGAPEQLGKHLQRGDTNERVEIIENTWPAQNLTETLRDWQALSEGTRGFKGLYHVNIDPAQDYVMSMEQWQRCVEVLEKELGFDGLPRAVVMHQKHGRQHIHVVWCRTDVETMTMRSDSLNYVAHERASKALELEFGHELVLGRHAKRDREKQPDFPRSEMTHDEWQQFERTGISPKQRKEEITALKNACGSGQAFKAALEERGYILAQGDRRNFVIVDERGVVHSLSRQIPGMKASELRVFMEGVDRSALPSAHDASDIQKQRREQRQQEFKDQKTDTSAPGQPKAEPQGEQERQRHEEMERVRKAVEERAAAEHRSLAERHAAEYARKESELTRLNAEAERAFLSDQQQKMKALAERHRLETSGIKGLWEAFQRRIDRAAAAEKAAQRRRDIEALRQRQVQELKDLLARREQSKQLELENLKERQAQQLRDHAHRSADDLERHLHEAEDAQRLRAELEAQERERTRGREPGDGGPEWPPPPKPTR